MIRICNLHLENPGQAYELVVAPCQGFLLRSRGPGKLRLSNGTNLSGQSEPETFEVREHEVLAVPLPSTTPGSLWIVGSRPGQVVEVLWSG